VALLGIKQHGYRWHGRRDGGRIRVRGNIGHWRKHNIMRTAQVSALPIRTAWTLPRSNLRAIFLLRAVRVGFICIFRACCCCTQGRCCAATQRRTNASFCRTSLTPLSFLSNAALCLSRNKWA